MSSDAMLTKLDKETIIGILWQAKEAKTDSTPKGNIELGLMWGYSLSSIIPYSQRVYDILNIAWYYNLTSTFPSYIEEKEAQKIYDTYIKPLNDPKTLDQIKESIK